MTDKQFIFFKKIFKLMFKHMGEYSLESFRYEADVFNIGMEFLTDYFIETDEQEFILASYVETMSSLKINSEDEIDELNKEDIVIPIKKDIEGWVEFRAISIVTEFYRKSCYLPASLEYDLDKFSIQPINTEQEFLDTWDHERKIND